MFQPVWRRARKCYALTRYATATMMHNPRRPLSLFRVFPAGWTIARCSGRGSRIRYMHANLIS